MTNDYRHKLALRVFHPAMAPDAITAALGMSPNHAWRAGDPHVARDGTPRGVRAQSYWAARLSASQWPPTPLAAAIDAWAGKLAPRAPFLRRVRAEGGGAELFIGWFLADQGGDTLPAELLARVAALGLDLAFDIYPAQGKAAEPPARQG